MAASSPFFQYNQPKITPPIPFSNTARRIMRGVIVVSTAVAGKWPRPKIIAAETIATQIVVVEGLTSLDLENHHIIQTSRVTKNSLNSISSPIPP